MSFSAASTTRTLSNPRKPSPRSQPNECATRPVLECAHGVLEAQPSSRTRAPHPVMIHQIGCVASVKPNPFAWLAATTVPATATPSAAPTCRPVDAIAAATPACDKGMPATALLVIAGLTIPRPSPNNA